MWLFKKNYTNIESYSDFLRVEEKYLSYGKKSKYKQREDFPTEEDYYEYLSGLERKEAKLKRTIKYIIFVPLGIFLLLTVTALTVAHFEEKEKKAQETILKQKEEKKKEDLLWKRLGYKYIPKNSADQKICFDRKCEEYIYYARKPTTETTRNIVDITWMFDKLKLTKEEIEVNKKDKSIHGLAQQAFHKWFSLPYSEKLDAIANGGTLQEKLDYLKAYRKVRIGVLKRKIEVLKRQNTLTEEEVRLINPPRGYRYEHLHKKVLHAINALDKELKVMIHLYEIRVKKYNEITKYRIEHNYPKDEIYNHGYRLPTRNESGIQNASEYQQ